MWDVRICQCKEFDQQKESNLVGNHIQCVPLLHTLLTMDNIEYPIPVYQDDQGMEMIEIKNKMISRRPYMENRPQYSNSINIIKCVLCIKK